jgi:hypothetical protein
MAAHKATVVDPVNPVSPVGSRSDIALGREENSPVWRRQPHSASFSSSHHQLIAHPPVTHQPVTHPPVTSQVRRGLIS